MPGRFYLTSKHAEIKSLFGLSADASTDIATGLDIPPGTDIATVVADPDTRLTSMRWGFMPMGRKDARGRPVMKPIINARSETVFEKLSFRGAKRAIVPVNGWYEWTGEKRQKQRWRICAPDWPVMAFAAIWDRWQAPGGLELASLATLTCEPNRDVIDIHHRMPVILHPESWNTWLTAGDEQVTGLMKTLESGLLAVEKCDDFDH